MISAFFNTYTNVVQLVIHVVFAKPLLCNFQAEVIYWYVCTYVHHLLPCRSLRAHVPIEGMVRYKLEQACVLVLADARCRKCTVGWML